MKVLLFTLVLTCLFTACSSNKKVTIDSTVHSQADFKNFKTYRWHEFENDDSVNKLMQEFVQEQIDTDLKGKGMTLLGSGEVDFLVNYIVNVRDDVVVEKFDTYGSNVDRYSGFNYYGHYTNVVTFDMKKAGEYTNVTPIVKGTIIIDILEPGSEKILMRLIASKPIGDKTPSADERKRRVAKVVGQMLENFPPVDKSNQAAY